MIPRNHNLKLLADDPIDESRPEFCRVWNPFLETINTMQAMFASVS